MAVTQDPRKMRYIDWLTTPPPMRDPQTEEELALTIDVHTKTLYNWRHDPEFKAVWHQETDKVVGGDDRRQAVIDALFEAASDPDHPRCVSAAKEYREWLKLMAPPDEPGTVTASKPLTLLSDEELKDLLARGIQNQQIEFHDGDAA